MIISASRRTDIPAFYSQWFFNRIKEGYVLVPNPYHPKMISRISLSPAVVDCFVFWTKNPAPMLTSWINYRITTITSNLHSTLTEKNWRIVCHLSINELIPLKSWQTKLAEKKWFGDMIRYWRMRNTTFLSTRKHSPGLPMNSKTIPRNVCWDL